MFTHCKLINRMIQLKIASENFILLMIRSQTMRVKPDIYFIKVDTRKEKYEVERSQG